MHKHIFIIIRYSVLTESQSSWEIGRDKNNEEYKNRLFDHNRLSLHERLFREVTVPSINSMITAQNQDNLTVLVLTSEELPSPYLENLHDLLAPYPWFKVFPLPSNKKMYELINSTFRNELGKFNGTVCFATTRLDDDDALASGFMNELLKYLSPSFNGFCVSFSNGVAGIYDKNTGTYRSFHSYYYPKIALGLSYINTYEPVTKSLAFNETTIYSLGKHTTVDFKRPTIIDARNPMFLRTFHTASDSIGKAQISKIIKNPKVNNDDITRIFSIQNV